MTEPKSKRKSIDWEAVEREFCAGFRSLRDIASEFGCAESAIRKKAKEKGWERDLSVKIQNKADALVRKEEVRSEVRTKSTESERELIDANAQMIANTVLNQRRDIQRLMDTVLKLWAEIEAIGDYGDEFRAIGELLRKENDFGQDRINDAYQYVISMPQRVKSVKLLAESLKLLIELQRKVLRLDERKDPNENNTRTMTDAQIATRIAFILQKAREAKAQAEGGEQ